LYNTQILEAKQRTIDFLVEENDNLKEQINELEKSANTRLSTCNTSSNSLEKSPTTDKKLQSVIESYRKAGTELKELTAIKQVKLAAWRNSGDIR